MLEKLFLEKIFSLLNASRSGSALLDQGRQNGSAKRRQRALDRPNDEAGNIGNVKKVFLPEKKFSARLPGNFLSGVFSFLASKNTASGARRSQLPLAGF
jgi:hypothetical protein